MITFDSVSHHYNTIIISLSVFASKKAVGWSMIVPLLLDFNGCCNNNYLPENVCDAIFSFLMCVCLHPSAHAHLLVPSHYSVRNINDEMFFCLASLVSVAVVTGSKGCIKCNHKNFLSVASPPAFPIFSSMLRPYWVIK